MSPESNGSGQLSGSEIGRPRLLQRVHEAIRVRHYSRRTEEAYVPWIKRPINSLIYSHVLNMGDRGVASPLDQLETGGRP